VSADVKKMPMPKTFFAPYLQPHDTLYDWRA
jgi:hypothetical protein